MCVAVSMTDNGTVRGAATTDRGLSLIKSRLHIAEIKTLFMRLHCNTTGQHVFCCSFILTKLFFYILQGPSSPVFFC